ncbi:MAG: type I-C CRISPR-associated protein Cas8c/Csd1, partial [Nitrospinae bacterium CG11_big_fil_rev_8_21_14_0_20_56_8]
MILQSLHHYYERKSKDPDSGLAPSGFEPAKISFVIVLDNEGKFVDIEDVREGTGKKKKGKSFLVPQSVKKSVNIAANLLWGSLDYLLGIDIKNKPDRVKKQKKAFVEKILTTFPQPETDAGILATVKFLQSPLPEALAGHALWEEIIKTSPNVTFRLQNDNRLICQRPVVIETLTTTENRENSGQAICLVTGQADETERLHPSIKGVWGAQSSGANIVSFNLGAVNSFTKEQGFNAPVGKRAAFNYTTALNHLLREGSPQRMQVGDASTAFWSEKENRFEDVFADFFQEPPKDDPGRNTRAVQALFSAPQTGTCTWEGDGTRFYILGLAPNVARISVRFWHNTTVGDLAQNIRLHFKDTEIVHPPHNPQYLSIF